MTARVRDLDEDEIVIPIAITVAPPPSPIEMTVLQPTKPLDIYTFVVPTITITMNEPFPQRRP